MNKLVKPLKSLLKLCDKNGYTNGKVMEELEGTYEVFKTHHNEFIKECAKLFGGPSSSSSSLISLIPASLSRSKNNLNQVDADANDIRPASNGSHAVGTDVGGLRSEDNKTENMPAKNEKLEKLSREFHRLNFLRIKKREKRG